MRDIDFPPAYQFDLAIRLGALPPDAVGVIGAASLWLRWPRTLSA